MENRNITYIGGVAIILLLALAIIGFVSNSKNKKNLQAERAQTETLTNQNQQVHRELDSLRGELGSLTTRNDSTAKRLAESEERTTQGGRRIASLTRENKSLNQSKADLEELQRSNATLDSNYNNLRLEQEKLLAQNRDLQNSLAANETQRNDITARLEKTILYNSDNFLVTATRGKKDKIVACASRAKRLNLSFSVPQDLRDSITYKIESPSGITINQGTSFIPAEKEYYTAGITGIMHAIQNPRQVNLIWNAPEKLKKGEYRIQFTSNGNTIGNCRLMLK